jgi:protocatechuate 3,4-dioxygenase beta subunit
MSRFRTLLDRRRFLQSAAFTTAAFTTPGLFAEVLERTPRQTEGPFYPNKLPLDTDNDLLIINDTITPAVGTITHLTGRVLSEAGEPVRNAVVEIWQADNNGVYIHTGSANKKNEDRHFQGFGRFLTDSTGEYYFRTIKPVPYVPRTPHIHVAVLQNGRRMLTTQLYIKGEPMNEKDFVYRAVDPKGQQLISVEFKPIEGSSLGELAANFDIIIGHTPEEPEEGQAAGRPRLRAR